MVVLLQIVYIYIDLFFLWGDSLTTQLREYPVKFAFALVDLYDEMTATARTVPVPNPVQPAELSLQAMPEESPDLDFVGMKEVFNYLRRGKHLRIPPKWRPLIPKLL